MLEAHYVTRTGVDRPTSRMERSSFSLSHETRLAADGKRGQNLAVEKARAWLTASAAVLYLVALRGSHNSGGSEECQRKR